MSSVSSSPSPPTSPTLSTTSSEYYDSSSDIPSPGLMGGVACWQFFRYDREELRRELDSIGPSANTLPQPTFDEPAVTPEDDFVSISLSDSSLESFNCSDCHCSFVSSNSNARESTSTEEEPARELCLMQTWLPERSIEGLDPLVDPVDALINEFRVTEIHDDDRDQNEESGTRGENDEIQNTSQDEMKYDIVQYCDNQRQNGMSWGDFNRDTGYNYPRLITTYTYQRFPSSVTCNGGLYGAIGEPVPKRNTPENYLECYR